MLSSALATHRVFALSHEPVPESGCGIGSAGLIRACVANPDGTSHLMLQGIGRIRFREWLPGESYPRARVEKLPVSAFDETAVRGFQAEIRELCQALDSDRAREFLKMDGHGDGHIDIGYFSDLAASSLVTDQALRLRLLEDLDVTSRLSIIIAYLRHLRDAK